MVTRNDLYRDYCKRNENFMSDSGIRMAFMSMSDDELAKDFNLKPFGKGRFVI